MVVRGARQKWLILVVEDDADLLELMTRVLEKEDFEVMTATNGREGLALASARPKPNLIISDIMMPDMDGLEMVRAIKHDPNTKPTPVIFLTSKSTPQDLVAGIQAGARHYLTKPFRVPDLVAKVRSVLPVVPD
jgi:DNA-binding response OmpR family regulator